MQAALAAGTKEASANCSTGPKLFAYTGFLQGGGSFQCWQVREVQLSMWA